jgi:hypothetical protein
MASLLYIWILSDFFGWKKKVFVLSIFSSLWHKTRISRDVKLNLISGKHFSKNGNAPLFMQKLTCLLTAHIFCWCFKQACWIFQQCWKICVNTWHRDLNSGPQDQKPVSNQLGHADSQKVAFSHLFIYLVKKVTIFSAFFVLIKKKLKIFCFQ